MNSKENFLSPEGFKELHAYLKKDKSSEVVKAEEIQNYLSKNHKFSKGKITGIIKRAEEKGMIENIGWGIYEFNNSYIKEERDGKVSVIKEINNEVSTAISKIETIVGKNFSILEDNEIIEIKNKIKALQEIIEIKSN